MIEQLTAFAASVPADGSVRTVVIRGSGPVFSAGADVQWMGRMLGFSHEENLADARKAGISEADLDTAVDVIAAVDAGIIQSLNIRATAQLKRDALRSQG